MARALELKVDVTRVVEMLLVHDLGEIDAGDKFVFAQDGWEERKAAEQNALERICGLAPKKTRDFLLGLWKEFDAGESNEARFAKGYRSQHARPFEPQQKRRTLAGKRRELQESRRTGAP